MIPNEAAPSDRNAGSLECSLEHAQAAYANGQEIIRFLDTKSAAVIGLATLTTGIPMGALTWALTERGSAPSDVTAFLSDPAACIRTVFAVLLVALIVGSACIGTAFQSLLARTGNGTMILLFPFYKGRERHEFGRLGERLVQGINLSFRLDEYRREIFAVGVIIYKKSFWHRWSMILLGGQILALMLALGLLLTGLYQHWSADGPDMIPESRLGP